MEEQNKTRLLVKLTLDSRNSKIIMTVLAI